MRRQVILGVLVVFLLVLSALTVEDVVLYGPTPLSILAIVLLAFFWTIVIGVLRTPPAGG